MLMPTIYEELFVWLEQLIPFLLENKTPEPVMKP
jgi:hypothetical protein